MEALLQLPAPDQVLGLGQARREGARFAGPSASYGGRQGRIASSCAGRSVSEHKEGRAVDWMLNAKSATDRARAQQVPPAGLRHRVLRSAARAGPPDGDHVHHLERPDVGVVRRVQRRSPTAAPRAGTSRSGSARRRCGTATTCTSRSTATAATARPASTPAGCRAADRAEPLRRPAPRRRRCRPRHRSSPRCRWPGALPGRRRSRRAGSAVRCASAPGCAPTSRPCARR